MTQCSLNEITTQFTRASRAVGFSWGQAEDIGYAARCLSEYLPGRLGVLLEYLRTTVVGAENSAPVSIDTDTWRGPENEPICPLLSGMLLTDLFGDCDAPIPEVCMVNVLRPVLIVPFVHFVAGRRDMTIVVSAQSLPLVCTDGSLLGLDTLRSALEQTRTLQLRRGDSLASASAECLLARQTASVMIDDDVWTSLCALSAKTYVRATHAGRLTGAGASLSDND